MKNNKDKIVGIRMTQDEYELYCEYGSKIRNHLRDYMKELRDKIDSIEA